MSKPACLVSEYLRSMTDLAVFSFTKSLFVGMMEEEERQKEANISAAPESIVAALEVELEEKLARLRIEQYTHLRMVSSHPYNIERLMRTKAKAEQLSKLRQKFLEITDQKTLLDQLLANDDMASKLEQYMTGLGFMRSNGERLLGGFFHLETALGYIENEREAAESHCKKCGSESPKLPCKLIPVCPYLWTGFARNC